ncbi:MAG: 3-keto-5-aminohexanoate cleavage protein [Promethearchaeota archaeon]
MSDDVSKKVIITAALAGAATVKGQNSNVPYTAEEFGDEAKKCYDAGASIVHLHFRNPETGVPTPDLEIIREGLENIKSKCPQIIINLTSAISPVVEESDRIKPIKTFKPPLASLNSNSMNFSVGDHKTGKVTANHSGIFANHFQMIQKFARTMKKVGTKPEIEIYDIGGLYNILFLNKQENLFDRPLHFQFVFGVLGGIPFSPMNLGQLLTLMPMNSTWSVCGVAKQQFQAAMSAVALGGHVRVGLEDNIRLVSGELAKGSWEQVKWAVELVKLSGLEIATPDDTREILNLKNRDITL